MSASQPPSTSEAQQQQAPVVDPEVRAYVYSLVTALGGSGSSETGQYVLGDDALGVLRDIKKWLRHYDEKANRMDVARCLAESKLVNRDLIPILAMNGDDEAMPKNKIQTRIALSCLELLVPLTWPLEIHEQMTINHHRHLPYLRHSQLIYKQGILGYDIVPILRVIIQIALPSITSAHHERSSRDEGIIKLMLYLFRNLAAISPLGVMGWTQEDDDAARSATITAFQEQDVFALLSMMCSNVSAEFAFQDTILLEIFFHLLKGVDPAPLFAIKKPQEKQRATELTRLLEKEATVNRAHAKDAPTRHGRFGTMIWVKRDEDKMSTMSGQTLLKDDGAALLQKMDESKKWTRPNRKKNPEDSRTSIYSFSNKCKLAPTATTLMASFVEEFLDSSFNPLFIQVRKTMDREAERVTESTPLQFFYLISWFLQADRLRRRARHAKRKEQRRQQWAQADPVEPADDTNEFELVAGVFEQETLIALNRAMQKALDNKQWRALDATMRCFTQILLTVQDMMASHVEEDRDIADNILQRIFYEETTHDRIVAIIRGYKDQGFHYLDACTELSHIFLRMLEQYSKSNTGLQIRSRRKRQRKKASKKSQTQSESQGPLEDEEMEGLEGGEEEEEDEEELDEQQAQSLAAERTFDFKRLSHKFCCQNSVDTFVTFISHYRELSPEQLKRAHRFFHRVAFKQDMSVLLYRVDIIALFYRMIKGPEGLDTRNPMFVEWEGLVRLILRNMIQRLRETPELLVEMLFSKIRSTQFFLEFGHERPVLHKEEKKKKKVDANPRNDNDETEANNALENQGEEEYGRPDTSGDEQERADELDDLDDANEENPSDTERQAKRRRTEKPEENLNMYNN